MSTDHYNHTIEDYCKTISRLEHEVERVRKENDSLKAEVEGLTAERDAYRKSNLENAAKILRLQKRVQELERQRDLWCKDSDADDREMEHLHGRIDRLIKAGDYLYFNLERYDPNNPYLKDWRKAKGE